MFPFKPLLLICILIGFTIIKPYAQNPEYPYTYTTTLVTFESRVADVVLEGTVTIPEGEGPFPGVVLVRGSYNIDESLSFRPIFSIADYLSRNGVAVLRYDEIEPILYYWYTDNQTSEKLSEDIHVALDFLEILPRINPKQTGLIGFGEGGFQTAIAVAKNLNANFVISLGGNGISGKERIPSGPSVYRDVIEIIENEPDNSLVTAALQSYFFELYPNSSSHANDRFVSPYTPYFSNFFRFILFTDSAIYWSKITAPVLALQGSLDSSILAEKNLYAIETALREGGNSNITIMELPNVNNLFQHTEAGSIEESYAPGKPFSPEALEIMREWIFKTISPSDVNNWILYL